MTSLHSLTDQHMRPFLEQHFGPACAPSLSRGNAWHDLWGASQPWTGPASTRRTIIPSDSGGPWRSRVWRLASAGVWLHHCLLNWWDNWRMSSIGKVEGKLSKPPSCHATANEKSGVVSKPMYQDKNIATLRREVCRGKKFWQGFRKKQVRVAHRTYIHPAPTLNAGLLARNCYIVFISWASMHRQPVILDYGGRDAWFRTVWVDVLTDLGTYSSMC